MPLSTGLPSRAVRILGAILLGLSVVCATATAQPAAPRQGLAAPAAQTRSGSSPGVAATPWDRTCNCDMNCNGTTYTYSSNGPNGPLITTAMRQECQSKCDAWAQANLTAWATALGPKACKSMQCAGSSQLSTGDPIGVGPYNVDTSGLPQCKDGNACCPGFTKALTPGQLATVFTEGAHSPGQPYTMTFGAGGAFATSFANNLKAWMNWLAFDGCKDISSFQLTFQLFNTNSATKPTGPNPPPGSGPVQFTQNVTFHQNGSVSPPVFAWTVPASPNWWFVKVTVTPLDRIGRPVECAKVGGCLDRLYTGWIDDAITAMKTAPSGTPATKLRMLD